MDHEIPGYRTCSYFLTHILSSATGAFSLIFSRLIFYSITACFKPRNFRFCIFYFSFSKFKIFLVFVICSTKEITSCLTIIHLRFHHPDLCFQTVNFETDIRESLFYTIQFTEVLAHLFHMFYQLSSPLWFIIRRLTLLISIGTPAPCAGGEYGNTMAAFLLLPVVVRNRRSTRLIWIT